jgi:hypothetical protein
MIHTLITILIIYCAFRAAVRPRQPDPMAGRLVARAPHYGPTPAAYTCPEALAWHAEQARLDQLDSARCAR